MKLTDRYVYAVSKYIPAPQKEDIEKEIRGLIDDMIEQRGGYSDDTEELVLKELGHPRMLADKYLDRKSYLIGPELYSTYLSVLKIVITIAVITSVIGNTIDFLTRQTSPVDFFTTLFSGMLMGAATSFGWITIIFAVFERKSKFDIVKELHQDWKPKDLPEIVDTGKHFGTTSTLVGIGFTILFIILMNGYRHLIGVYYISDGITQFSPILNEDVIKTYLPFINILFALQILFSVSKLLAKKWTYPVAGGNLIINALSLVLALTMLQNPNLLNFDAFAIVSGAPNLEPIIRKSFDITLMVLKVILPLAFLIDSFEGFRNAYMNGRSK